MSKGGWLGITFGTPGITWLRHVSQSGLIDSLVVLGRNFRYTSLGSDEIEQLSKEYVIILTNKDKILML